MKDRETTRDYRDRAAALRAVGCLLLCAGSFLALMAPLETQCFAFFSQGGRFCFEGFGYGSFMFVNIAAQIMVYAVLAAVFLPLGYAHLRLRRWVADLSLACLWAWLGIGLPVIPVLFFLLAASKDMAPVAAVAAALVLGASYLIIPILMIRFYRGQNVARTLRERDPGPCFTDRFLLRALILCVYNVFYLIEFLILLLFKGFCPVFGIFLTGIAGSVVLCVMIACCLILIWRLLRRKNWARWGTAVLAGIAAASMIITFASHGYKELLEVLPLASLETDVLGGIPLTGIHIALLTGVPFFSGFAAAVIPMKKNNQSGTSIL